MADGNRMSMAQQIWKQSEKYPPLSTYSRFQFGQTRVTERKRSSPAGKPLAFRKTQKERTIMSNSNNNQLNIPQAREAMDRFKMQAAQDEDVSATS